MDPPRPRSRGGDENDDEDHKRSHGRRSPALWADQIVPALAALRNRAHSSSDSGRSDMVTGQLDAICGPSTEARPSGSVGNIVTELALTRRETHVRSVSAPPC